MSTFIFVLLVAGIAYLALFHKPQNYSETELKKWFSSKLLNIAENLENDIEKDSRGEYPHAGKQSFEKQGTIVYVLLDKNYSRFDVSDKNTMTLSDLMATTGYTKLEEKTRSLNLSMRLEEKEVDGDGVQSFNSLDEYIDDFPRYYTVTIGGW